MDLRSLTELCFTNISLTIQDKSIENEASMNSRHGNTEINSSAGIFWNDITFINKEYPSQT